MSERNLFRHPAPRASSSSRRLSNDDNPNIDINTRATRANPPQHLQPTGSSNDSFFGFSNPQANLPMPLANRLPMPRLPPIHALGVPAPLPGTAGGVDLSEISRATLNIPEDTVGFRMSESLRNDILNFERPRIHTSDSLVERLRSEAKLYANDRRNEMKRIDKPITEARRTRFYKSLSKIEEDEYERALLDALKWLFRKLSNNNANQDGINEEKLKLAPASATSSISGQARAQHQNHQNLRDRDPSIPANLQMDVVNPFSMTPLPPVDVLLLGVPLKLPGTPATVHLSEIPHALFNIPEGTVGFRMSESLRNDALNFERPRIHTSDSLVERLRSEAKSYAENRKKMERTEMKTKQSVVKLIGIEKKRLNDSRYRALLKFKRREYQRALLDSIKWLIGEINDVETNPLSVTP